MSEKDSPKTEQNNQPQIPNPAQIMMKSSVIAMFIVLVTLLAILVILKLLK